MPTNTDLIDAARLRADDLFSSFHFGEDVTVVGTSAWDTSDATDLTRIVYVQFADDPVDASSHRLSFHVRLTREGNVEEIYALDLATGNDIGGMLSA